MIGDRDPIVRRAIDELRELPESDSAAITKIVQAAAEARLTPADDIQMLALPRARGARWWVMGSVAVAAGAAGFAVSTLRDRTIEQPAKAPLAIVATSAESNAPAAAGASTDALPESVSDAELRPVAKRADLDALPVERQFVFNSHAAHRVALVGDFNQWNPASAPMRKTPDGDLWSVSVRLTPGRHVYGFMVDDSIFVLDPRAAHARDADLGTDGSVIVIGRQ